MKEDVSASPLWSKDLAPTTPAERTWNRWHLAGLWIGMAVCIPTVPPQSESDNPVGG